LATLLADVLIILFVTHKGSKPVVSLGAVVVSLGAARLACLAAGKDLATGCKKPEIY
jgi:xylulokinase